MIQANRAARRLTYAPRMHALTILAIRRALSIASSLACVTLDSPLLVSFPPPVDSARAAFSPLP